MSRIGASARSVASLDRNGPSRRGSPLSAISRGLGQLEALTNRAQILSDRAAQIRSKASASITGASGSGFDPNYGQNELAISSPLGTQGNFQSFGDYVCIRKSFLADLRTLLFELLAKREEV